MVGLMGGLAHNRLRRRLVMDLDGREGIGDDMRCILNTLGAPTLDILAPRLPYSLWRWGLLMDLSHRMALRDDRRFNPSVAGVPDMDWLTGRYARCRLL